MTGQQHQSRVFAVNMLSSSEGYLDAVSTLELGQDEIVGTAGGSRNTPLWPWAVGLCLGLLMIEWWVYHRKTYF